MEKRGWIKKIISVAFTVSIIVTMLTVLPAQASGAAVTNGNFEEIDSGWTMVTGTAGTNGYFSTDTAITHNASNGCYVMTSEETMDLAATAPITGLESGHKYKITFFLKLSNVSGVSGAGIRLQILGGVTSGSKAYSPYYIGTSEGWQKIQINLPWTAASYSADGGLATAKLMWKASGTAYIDDISIEDITGEYFQSGAFEFVPSSGDTGSYDIMSRGYDWNAYSKHDSLTVMQEGDNRFGRITGAASIAFQPNLTGGDLMTAFSAGNSLKLSFKFRVSRVAGTEGTDAISPYFVTTSGYLSGLAPIGPDYYGQWIDIDIYITLATAENMLYFRSTGIDFTQYNVDVDDFSVTLDNKPVIKGGQIISTTTKGSTNVYKTYAIKPADSYQSTDAEATPFVHFATASTEDVNYVTFSAIYSKDASGVRTFECVSPVKSGTAKFGTSVSEALTVRMPEISSEKTYTVEVYIWDGFNTITPYVDKSIYPVAQ